MNQQSDRIRSRCSSDAFRAREHCRQREGDGSRPARWPRSFAASPIDIINEVTVLVVLCTSTVCWRCIVRGMLNSACALGIGAESIAGSRWCVRWTSRGLRSAAGTRPLRAALSAARAISSSASRTPLGIAARTNNTSTYSYSYSYSTGLSIHSYDQQPVLIVITSTVLVQFNSYVTIIYEYIRVFSLCTVRTRTRTRVTCTKYCKIIVLTDTHSSTCSLHYSLFEIVCLTRMWSENSTCEYTNGSLA